MGRRRLIAMLTGAVLLVPVPAAALDTDLAVEATDEAAEQLGGDESAGSDEDLVTVPLPGLGEASASADLDPEAGSGEVSTEVEVSTQELSAEPEATLSGSTDEGLTLEAAAPITAGPVSADPVDALAPIVEVADEVVPGVDVRPAAPRLDDPVGEGDRDDVRSAGLPGGGPQHDAGAPPTVSVLRRSPRPAPVVTEATEPTTAFAAPAETAPSFAPRNTGVAAPALPDPVGVPALLRLLTAVLVVAAGFTNRIVARELR